MKARVGSSFLDNLRLRAACTIVRRIAQSTGIMILGSGFESLSRYQAKWALSAGLLRFNLDPYHASYH